MILRPLIRMHRDGLMGDSANHPTGIERSLDDAREPKHIVEFSRLADQYPVNGADKSRVKNDPLGLPVFSHARHDEAGTLAGKSSAPEDAAARQRPSRKADRAQRVSAGRADPVEADKLRASRHDAGAGDADGAKLLPKSIASAHAATGNSSVQRPSTTAIFLMASSTEPGDPF